MVTRKITELPVAASASSGDYVIASVSSAARRVPMLVSDASLSMPGQAAEAKATGDRLNALDRATENLNAVAEDLNDRMLTADATLSQSGQAAEAKATGERLSALDRATENLNAVAEDLNDRMLTADATLS
ncbi:MAG: hypothetical protein U0L09_07035, partial [Christensenellales bacterium]|nr:hypothetical protein [Christensenellales bacterium]